MIPPRRSRWAAALRAPAGVLFLLAACSGSTDPDQNATTGEVRVSTVTSGSRPDPDGYSIALDGGAVRAIGANASVTF